MSNGTPVANNNGLHPAVQVTQMILQTVTMLFVMWMSVQQHKNGEKIDSVGSKQEEAVDRTEAAQRASEDVKRTVKESVPDRRSREIQLWTNWKYLESIADGSSTAEDKAKAADAKRLYDEFRSNKH